jgi:long-chain acyl-CoA synthetase
VNVAELLHRSARIYPTCPALAVGTDVVADYRTLAVKAASLAATLRGRLGLAAGDRVALFMANCPQYVEILFACWHGGLVAVPINAKLHPKELEYILQNSGARLCFVTGAYAFAASSVRAVELVEVVDVGSAAYDVMSAGGPMQLVTCDPDSVAWLFYTSGTTGRPKGVMITHRNLLAIVCNYFIDLDPISPHDSILHAAPMSHGSGLYILPHIVAGAVNIAPESGGFEPDEVHQQLQSHRGVTIFAVPTMVKRMVDERSGDNPPNLKTIVYGGGPMYVEDCKRAMDRFGNKLAQIYGQGEAPMTITVMNKAVHSDHTHPRCAERRASVGYAFAGVQVAIGDSQDRPVPTGGIGEVLVRGDVVMRGYWDNSLASHATLRGGWLHTGDVGVLDQDGFLTLKDRSKDVIISGGSNIYPREVEEVLMRHAAVEEVAVLGQRDPEWGESVVAFVVLQAGASVTAADLDRLCLEHIARFKRPKRYEFVRALPKNMTGKTLKAELRKMLG